MFDLTIVVKPQSAVAYLGPGVVDAELASHAWRRFAAKAQPGISQVLRTGAISPGTYDCLIRFLCRTRQLRRHNGQIEKE